MTFKYKVGDLISAAKAGDVDVIAHGANCHCTMGSGIAPLIKNAFPSVYEADCKTQRGDKEKLGKFSYAVMDSGLVVFNLYTQYGYNRRNLGLRDLKYDALYDSLVEMKNFLKLHTDGFMTDRKIGFPKIGAGLAGGDWNVIEAMIKSIFWDCDVTIYILNEKEKPDEKESK